MITVEADTREQAQSLDETLRPGSGRPGGSAGWPASSTPPTPFAGSHLKTSDAAFGRWFAAPQAASGPTSPGT
jgi:hypothetical protein